MGLMAPLGSRCRRNAGAVGRAGHGDGWLPRRYLSRGGFRLVVAGSLLASALAVQGGAGPALAASGGTWTTTGSLPTTRSGHTATVLTDGKVLVAGGFVPGGPGSTVTSSALLYTPATGTWSSTGSMLVRRWGHTATLLPNGTVLVAGGNENGITAEIYDPGLGIWRPTEPMSVTRLHHTATALSNGMVLVAGGRSIFTPVPTAEIYEPVSGTWSPAGPMATRRTEHQAVLIDQAPCGDVCGRVLVTGGQVEPSATSSGTIATGSAELFDPLTRTWSTTSSFSPPRSDHTSTVLPTGKVLLVGGRTDTNVVTSSSTLFDPVTRTWSSTGAMTTGRSVHTATRLPGSGHVLVTGGTGELSSTELYDALTGKWVPAASMAAGRARHTASILQDGKVLAVGGFPTTSTELYGPALPVMSVGDVTVHEGDSGTRTAVFTVSLSEPAADAVTIAYATAKGTALGTDFTAKSGSLTFAAGATSATVKVAVTGDIADEGDEAFTLALSSPAGATIGDGTGVGTIVDDDPDTGRRLAIGDVSVHEGDAGGRAAVFSVSLSKASTGYVTVNFATVKGDAVGTDYTPRSGTLTFAPGSTSATVKVAITPDTATEGNEKFAVHLSNSNGPAISDDTGVGTIIDND